MRWLILSLLLCACAPPRELPPGPGDLAIRQFNPDDPTNKVSSTLQHEVAEVAFGSAFIGWTQRRDLVLVNMGTGPLTISTIVVLEGPAAVTPAGGQAFGVNFSSGLEIAPGTEVSVPVSYDGNSFVPATARLRVIADIGEADDSVDVTLSARPVSCVCSEAPDVDFGAVARGDTATRILTLRNPTQRTASYVVGAVFGTDARAFPTHGASGNVDVLPNGQRFVHIEFRPAESRDYLAFLPLETPSCCGKRNVQLRGRGVDQVLSTFHQRPDGSQNPNCDFGYVAPGNTRTTELSFANLGYAPITVNQLKFSTNEFKVLGADGGTLVVRGHDGTTDGGTVTTLRVSFTPGLLGPRTTTLAWTTNLATQPTGAMTCRGFGGGPDIDVAPMPTLDFGVIQSSSPPVTKRLTVSNVGTGASGDVSGNLHVGPPSLSPSSEISATLVQYPASTGLPGQVGQNTAYIDVTITPASAGQKLWELSIPSNDDDEPVVVVRITADVQP